MRLVGNVLVVLLAFSCMFLGVAESREAGKESEAQEMLERTDNILPNVTARSAVVMEARTGRVLYSRNMKARRFPASTTKAMTLIVALEKGNMDDVRPGPRVPPFGWRRERRFALGIFSTASS